MTTQTRSRRFTIRVPLVASILSILLVLGLANQAEASPNRYALVIGNSTYPDQPLANPVNDANLMASNLEGLGFKVYKHLDLDQRNMRRAILDFGDAMAEAGDDVVSLIYYAGHGLQVDGRNYLVPVDARIDTERDVAIEAIAADDMLSMVAQSDTSLNIVILDACRNNPYQRGFRSTAGRGLARMDAPSGTILAYSTSPGQVAADGEGANSPFTRAMVRAMNRPGIPVEEVFKRVRVDVMDLTGGQQVPWESSSLTGNFYFSGDASSGSAVAVSPEVAFWTSIVTENDPALFNAYLEQYPEGTFATVARLRVDAINNGQQTTFSVGGQTTETQVASVNAARAVSDIKFRPGKYKIDVVKEESRCVGISFDKVVAKQDSARGNWHHPEADGTVSYSVEDGIISVDMSGSAIYNSEDTVLVQGADLFVRLNVRHSAGSCKVVYHVRNLIAR
ncbi:MAG: caspase family protein [Rhodospirillales bacterium]